MDAINRLKYVLIILLICSCSSSDDEELATLNSYIKNQTIEEGGVIACAASDVNTGEILTFYYPESRATNVKFFQTNSVEDNNEDYTNYVESAPPHAPFFNGYLGKFTQASANEKWIIITFELDGEIKISNPIRTRQLSKPTVWNDNVTIDHIQSGMPKFSWEDNPFGDNEIYFQVISNSQNDLLSGTYTYENQFQYYDTSNVVLNITTQTPPQLLPNTDYNFTLMDVSLDNWVNWVVLNEFNIE